MSKDNENEMMKLLGDIIAGECLSVVVIVEKASKAGELSLVTRYGGVDADGARRLAANALWSKEQLQGGKS